ARFRRAGFALLVAGGLAVSGLGVTTLRHRSATTPAIVAAPTAARTGIEGLQQRLRDVPTDWSASAALGSAYVQQARITGDPTYYPKAEQALGRSLSLEATRNVPGFIGMGALAAARHDFARALVWGRRALAIDAY